VGQPWILLDENRMPVLHSPKVLYHDLWFRTKSGWGEVLHRQMLKVS
jgi:hypothetical protein